MTDLFSIAQGQAAPRVIFCDWHGVLCHKTYWHSVIDNPDHPDQQILSRHLNELFTSGNTEGREWMCGRRTSRTIVTDLTARHHTSLDAETLLTILAEDIARMPVAPRLLASLAQARRNAVVVLATDNIDTFAHAVRTHARAQPDHDGASTSPTLASATATFDDVLSSNELGVLKSEDPHGFFGPWLQQHRLKFGDALLIDDRSENCAAFHAHGGTAMHWQPISDGNSPHPDR
ncbi:hypothetical protein ACWEKT_20885 [Nocardia takedensis]